MKNPRPTGVTLRVSLVLALGLFWAGPGLQAQTPDPGTDPALFVRLMQDYLAFQEQFVNMADKPRTAVHMVIEGIVEIHQQRGEVQRAIERLEKMADEFQDSRTIVTLVRFKLRDLYRETGQPDKALAQLELILDEFE